METAQRHRLNFGPALLSPQGESVSLQATGTTRAGPSVLEVHPWAVTSMSLATRGRRRGDWVYHPDSMGRYLSSDG